MAKALLSAVLLLLLAAVSVNSESATSAACRKELVDLSKQTTLCPTCSTIFGLLGQAMALSTRYDVSAFKRSFLLLPSNDALVPYAKKISPLNITFWYAVGPLLVYPGNVTTIQKLVATAPKTYKTLKVQPLLNQQKIAYSVKGAAGSVYFGTKQGKKQSQVMTLIKSYPKCITAFQTNKVLIPPTYKV